MPKTEAAPASVMMMPSLLLQLICESIIVKMWKMGFDQGVSNNYSVNMLIVSDLFTLPFTHL